MAAVTESQMIDSINPFRRRKEERNKIFPLQYVSFTYFAESPFHFIPISLHNSTFHTCTWRYGRLLSINVKKEYRESLELSRSQSNCKTPTCSVLQNCRALHRYAFHTMEKQTTNAALDPN